VHRPTLADLTPAQRRLICNGCGPAGGAKWQALRPPQWHSRATCDAHDLAYWIGGGVAERAQADRELLNGMYRDAATRPWWQRPWYRWQAWTYYRSVQLLGWQFFHYGYPRALPFVIVTATACTIAGPGFAGEPWRDRHEGDHAP
jgi:hypothetical protein